MITGILMPYRFDAREAPVNVPVWIWVLIAVILILIIIAMVGGSVHVS